MIDKETIITLALLSKKTNRDENLANIIERPREVREIGKGHVESV